MTFGIRIEGITKNKAVLTQIRRDRLRTAMEDSLQIIMNSTLMGFVTRQAPDGKKWADNAPWWAEIKGQSSPLTGPITSEIKGGELKGAYKLKRVNTQRMKNSLTKENMVSSGTVRYDKSVEDRAKLNQYGGKSELEFIPISTSSPYDSTLVFNVEVAERPHLGVATYPRIGIKTDAQWVAEYFGDQIEIQLRDDLVIKT